MHRFLQPHRVAVLILLALLVTVLAAPGLALASPDSHASPHRWATAVGRVQRAPEVSICQQDATHVLVNENGSVIYQLVSANRRVDLSRYEGQRVRVIGTVSPPVEGCAPLMIVSRVVPPWRRRW